MQATKYEVHPAANIFPMMSDADFIEFKEDIAQHGCREPIVLLDGKLIDGRNRLKACNELGIEPQDCELTDEGIDPVAYVMSQNLHRRHLSTSQRTICSAKVATMKSGRPKETPPNGGIMTTEQAAAMFHVSVRLVERARVVLRDGCNELVRLVEQDDIKVSTAAKFIAETPDKREQTKIAKQGASAVREVLKQARESAAPKATTRGATPDNVKDFQVMWECCNKSQKTAIRAFVLSEEI